MKRLLTIPEAADRLRIGTSTLRRYLRRSLLRRVVLPGGDHRIRESDLEGFINSRTIENSQGS
jgi:excisionase family DNA binding protein